MADYNMISVAFSAAVAYAFLHFVVSKKSPIMADVGYILTSAILYAYTSETLEKGMSLLLMVASIAVTAWDLLNIRIPKGKSLTLYSVFGKKGR